MIDTGDTVFHRPTEETWIVAGVVGDRLMWCGWPEGDALVSDCDLVEKATPQARLALLKVLSAMQGADSRRTFAMEKLRDEVA